MILKSRVSSVAIAALAATAVISTSPVASAAQVDLKVGITHPLTGGLASYGPGMSAAASWGVKLVDAAMKKAKVGSCTVVGSEDDQATPAVAVEAVTKLVKSNGAQLIVGPLTSGATIAAAQSVTIPNKVIMISDAASSPDVTTLEDGDTLFRTYASDALQAKAIATWMGKLYGKTARVNVGARNDAFGSALAAAFRTEWRSGGGKVGRTVLWNPNAATFDSDAYQLVSGIPAEAWFIADYEETFAKVAPALARTKKWDATRTFVNETFNNAASIEVVGANFLNGVRGSSTAPNGTDTAAWKAEFKAAYPEFPGTFVDPSSFDAAVLGCLAAAYAKKTDAKSLAKGLRAVSGPAGKTYTYKKIKAAVKAVKKGKKITYQGVWGQMNFDAAGDPAGGVFDMFSVVDGKPVIDEKDRITFN
mgnify:CR=1 FL=1|jgi:ABC-type branched-subunit amino acid transport system substrate-binding protein